MPRADRAKLVDVAKAHAQAEADGDIAKTLATLEGEPVYELASVGLAFRGRAAARTYYEHFFTTFQPLISGYELVNEWVSDEGLGQEYWIHVALPDGTKECHRVIGILTFGERLLSGERLYASEMLLRRMLGPAYEEARRQSVPAPARQARVEELVATLATAPELAISDATTERDARDCHRSFGTLDRYEIGGGRFRGRSPWERHPFDDELLVALAGEAEVTLLCESGPTKHVLRAGQLFVVPRGVWHRQLARDGATIWGLTASAHDEISFAEDPREKGRALSAP